MVIAQAPFRMSFFGGGTDFPAFYEGHGGKVISTSIDKYCYVNVRHLPPFLITPMRSATLSGSVSTPWRRFSIRQSVKR